MRFEGWKVIVTGAGSGIGYEMARQFLEEGADVLAADVNPDGCPEGSLVQRVDVSIEDEVASMVETAVGEFGGLDVICNNAGIGSVKDVTSCSVEEWDRLFAVNVRGVFLGIKHSLPRMLDQEKGSIVNTASVAALVGFPNRAPYSSTKGAVIALTKQVAAQYAGTGVRCNCICPGTVASPCVEGLLAQAEDPTAMRNQLIGRQPVGRLGTSEEVAKAALYLASDDASFITGSSFVIDGGILVKG